MRVFSACWLILMLFGAIGARGQDTYVVVRKLEVSGNKKTKTQFILRELNFHNGDTIPLPELARRLDFNELQLMNTGLFNSVEIQIREWDTDLHEIGVEVKVEEGWYVLPIPLFELADRNFNVWLDDYGASLRRINYGMRFYHMNLTGRGDMLYGIFQLGFTQRFGLQYSRPYFDRRQRFGFILGFEGSRNKEINYTTAADRQQFFRSEDEFLLEKFQLQAVLTFRPKLQVYHRFGLGFHDNLIQPEVRNTLNPDYFLGGNRQRYFTAFAEVSVDRRDIRPYPIRGFFLRTAIRKNGLLPADAVQGLDVGMSHLHYLPLAKKWSMELGVRAKVALIRAKQPFSHSRALGYEDDYVRGYEYYVIDGIDFGIVKASLRRELINREFNLGRLIPFNGFRVLPLKVYLAAHSDLGYANNPYYAAGNTLPNTALWGYGLGLHIVAYYNKVFWVEYNWNRLGENGLFLRWAFSF